LSKFVYRTGIPFRVVESNAFIDFIKRLRPVYVKTGFPTAKVIATTLLDREYARLKEIGDNYLRNASCYSLTSDGWSNIKGQHMVNFIVHVPNQQPFFFKNFTDFD
jgi:hypothetical protein